nr:hypothetical protein [Candidatus Njordarchaeota archaeon]
MPRAKDETHRVSDEQRDRVDTLGEEWTGTTHSQGAEQKHCEFHRLPKDIQEMLRSERPRILESEAKMLREDFGIKTKMYPQEIYTRGDGYSVKWVIQTDSKEDTRTFYNEIGFPQRRKQEKLADILMNEGGK